MPPCVAAATGHRGPRLRAPRGITGALRLENIALAFLAQLQPDAAISGMALDWDQAFARAALRLRIPLICAIPCDEVEQTSRWTAGAAAEYTHVLRQATEVHRIGTQLAFNKACLARNEWMADRAHVVAAMWDGDRHGGTAHCVRYATDLGRPVVNLWGMQL